MKLILAFLIVFSGFLSSPLAAEAPRVGRGAASKYFSNRNPDQEEPETTVISDSSYSSSSAGAAHYLALHFGKMMSSTAYEWGTENKQSNVGNYTAGVTYRVGEWRNSMDLNIRIDFIEYQIVGEGEPKPLKMSIIPLITFPDAASKFPLYFGFGLGPGVFFRQTEGEASLSADYQLIAGARFFDVVDNGGFFIETGLKNHLHLWNSGQYNGSFLSGGAVFTF